MGDPSQYGLFSGLYSPGELVNPLKIEQPPEKLIFYRYENWKTTVDREIKKIREDIIYHKKMKEIKDQIRKNSSVRKNS